MGITLIYVRDIRVFSSPSLPEVATSVPPQTGPQRSMSTASSAASDASFPPDDQPRLSICYSRPEHFLPNHPHGVFSARPLYSNDSACFACLCARGDDTGPDVTCAAVCTIAQPRAFHDLAANRVWEPTLDAADWASFSDACPFMPLASWEYGCTVVSSRILARNAAYCTAKAQQTLTLGWESDECQLAPFDAAAFALRFSDRTILIMGDSVGRELFDAFACFLLRSQTRIAWGMAGWLQFPFEFLQSDDRHKANHFTHACAVLQSGLVLAFCTQVPIALGHAECLRVACHESLHVEPGHEAAVQAALHRPPRMGDVVLGNWGLHSGADGIRTIFGRTVPGPLGPLSVFGEMAAHVAPAAFLFWGVMTEHVQVIGQPECLPLDHQHNATSSVGIAAVEQTLVFNHTGSHGRTAFLLTHAYTAGLHRAHPYSSLRPDCRHYCEPGAGTLIARLVAQRMMSPQSDLFDADWNARWRSS